MSIIQSDEGGSEETFSEETSSEEEGSFEREELDTEDDSEAQSDEKSLFDLIKEGAAQEDEEEEDTSEDASEEEGEDEEDKQKPKKPSNAEDRIRGLISQRKELEKKVERLEGQKEVFDKLAEENDRFSTVLSELFPHSDDPIGEVKYQRKLIGVLDQIRVRELRNGDDRLARACQEAIELVERDSRMEEVSLQRQKQDDDRETVKGEVSKFRDERRVEKVGDFLSAHGIDTDVEWVLEYFAPGVAEILKAGGDKLTNAAIEKACNTFAQQKRIRELPTKAAKGSKKRKSPGTGSKKPPAFNSGSKPEKKSSKKEDKGKSPASMNDFSKDSRNFLEQAMGKMQAGEEIKL